jgi:catechol 2,3-dioxygenase-like lactoylglutathione lyase family enzyme
MMLQAVDHLIVAVADLDGATADYEKLLGRAPSWRGRHPGQGTCNALFRLDNTYLELLAADAHADGPLNAAVSGLLKDRPERPFGLALQAADLTRAVETLRGRDVALTDPVAGEGIDERTGARRTWRNAVIDSTASRGLRIMLVEHTSPADRLPLAAPAVADASECRGVDHVVIFTGDLEATLGFWRHAFGLDERWRREFPERSTVNVGLLLGGITIECMMRSGQATRPNRDHLWGVAYAVADCERAAARIRSSGIAVDRARPGLAPRTHVATVRWDRTPTLVVDKLPRAPK